MKFQYVGVALMVVLMVALMASSAPAVAANNDLPPKNPFLADSSIPIFHADSAQSGASNIAGPHGKTRQVKPAE